MEVLHPPYGMPLLERVFTNFEALHGPCASVDDLSSQLTDFDLAWLVIDHEAETPREPVALVLGREVIVGRQRLRTRLSIDELVISGIADERRVTTFVIDNLQRLLHTNGIDRVGVTLEPEQEQERIEIFENRGFTLAPKQSASRRRLRYQWPSPGKYKRRPSAHS